MQLKHYLIASETNEYKPWIVTPTAFAVFCVVIWALKLFVPTAIIYAQNSIDASDLMKKINSERTQRFIPALTTNSRLVAAATGKANDMLSRSYFAHIDPDGNYVWPRIESAGYRPYSTLGENLAMDFTSAEEVVDAWMNSPTHRANIVNAKFEDQGLSSIAGLFEPNHNTIVIASLFGTLIKTTQATPPPQPTAAPAAPSPAPKPTPSAPKTAISISQDIKIKSTYISGQAQVDVDVVIIGSPTLVTAQLKSQSITLIAGKVAGQYKGSFFFDQTEDLTNQTMTVEARDKSSNKVSHNFAVNIDPSGVVGENQDQKIPVSNEAGVIKILRIIFGGFAAIYVAFLAIDAVIIHQAKIKRPGIHSSTHALIFLLIAAISLLVG